MGMVKYCLNYIATKRPARRRWLSACNQEYLRFTSIELVLPLPGVAIVLSMPCMSEAVAATSAN